MPVRRTRGRVCGNIRNRNGFTAPNERDTHMDKRLIELALETLEARRTALDTEIADLRSQLSPATRRRAKRAAAEAPAPKRRGRSAAARKAQSLRMKAYWAKKKAGTRARKPRKAKAPAKAPAGTKTPEK